MDPLDLSFIDVTDVLYEGECALRFAVLREPLGMPRSSVAFPFEGDSLHLVATDPDGTVRACVLFHPDGDGGGRLLQMAVAPELRGEGVGRALVEHLEAELVERGIQSVGLHSRGDATGFYIRLGYAPVGPQYVELGIPHQNMRKTLSVDVGA